MSDDNAAQEKEITEAGKERLVLPNSAKVDALSAINANLIRIADSMEFFVEQYKKELEG